MKRSGAVVASVMAVSSIVFTSSNGDHPVADPTLPKQASSSSRNEAAESRGSVVVRDSSDKNQFAPRFDGLRFIETLVTAHR
ncbi:hypothetical protein ACLOJK_004669 [Asimina triloba]